MKVYRYSPKATVKWQPLAKGLYFTSCLTQCLFLSSARILTAGTDGHTVVWPLTSETTRLSAGSADPAKSPLTLSWQQPLRIQQSSSKVMASHDLDKSSKLVVSGGDDGSLAVLLLGRTWSTPSLDTAYAVPPVLLSRVHASAVTACTVLKYNHRIFILTSGNDQWIRLWEVTVRDGGGVTLPLTSIYGEDIVAVSRRGKMKTNVADVSSMAVLEVKEEGSEARVLICGVGMEVVRVEWHGHEGHLSV